MSKRPSKKIAPLPEVVSPVSTTTIIVLQVAGSSYGEFSSKGAFIGTRQHFANSFFSNVEPEQVKGFALNQNWKWTFYEVPDAEVDDFCAEYGADTEPTHLVVSSFKSYNPNDDEEN